MGYIFELCSLSCWLIVGFRYALVLEFTLCNSKLNWTISLLLIKCFQGAHECEQKVVKPTAKTSLKTTPLTKRATQEYETRKNSQPQ